MFATRLVDDALRQLCPHWESQNWESQNLGMPPSEWQQRAQNPQDKMTAAELQALCERLGCDYAEVSVRVLEALVRGNARPVEPCAERLHPDCVAFFELGQVVACITVLRAVLEPDPNGDAGPSSGKVRK
jgi:hypothetical protein